MLVFPLINDTSRKIIHIDMDAFFAAVEVRDDPSLKGKPVVIGNDPRQTGGRGVVSTCNYEARAFGIHSAMSSKEALKRCPHAIFLPGRYEYYKEVGQSIREIFKKYTDLVEPLSIDEAYLDVTKNHFGIKSAIKVAKLIQYDIWAELALTCSAGISYNKFIAKLASDYEKPKGLTVITPDEAENFLKRLPIEKFYGVGKKSVQELHSMGVFTGEDLLSVSEMELIDRFGKFGYDLYRKARGIHNAKVEPNRKRKSVGSERTYRKLLENDEDVLAEIEKNAIRVAMMLEKQEKVGKVLTLKIRYADFKTITKRMTLSEMTQNSDKITQFAKKLYTQLDENQLGIRLVGVSMSILEEDKYDILLGI